MNLIDLGYTGTRNGMTKAQHAAVYTVAANLRGTVRAVHHGDCVGGDEQFHAIAKHFAFRTIGHPPTDGRFRACCFFDELRDPLPYLQRNQQIVIEARVMIGAPHQSYDQTGGTWRTIAMARLASKPLAIVYPDGGVAFERWTW